METQVEPRGRLSHKQAHQLVVDVVGEHADSLLRVAQRHSACHDDAHDAYQRALEIFVRRADSLDPDRVVGWVHTVVKHEAFSIRAKRGELVSDAAALEREEARHDLSPEERVLDHERLAQTAEALRGLKPQELQALWHRSLGKSYAEIADDLEWTHTKVNRCLAEGRAAVAARVAQIETGAECGRWLPALSAMVDGEVGPEQLAELRPHLRACAACRAVVREMRSQRPVVAALLPPVAVAAHGTPLADAPGLLTRLYESVTGFLAERAALSAIKLQAAGDLVGSTKAAAVAASAVAVAGGGAVVADQIERPQRPATETAVRTGPTPARAAAPRALAPVSAALREARRVGAAPAKRRASARRRPRKRTSSTAREFSAGAQAKSSEFTSRATASSSTTAPDPSGTSRSFESGAMAPSRRSTQPTGTGRSQSGAEFGF